MPRCTWEFCSNQSHAWKNVRNERSGRARHQGRCQLTLPLKMTTHSFSFVHHSSFPSFRYSLPSAGPIVLSVPLPASTAPIRVSATMTRGPTDGNTTCVTQFNGGVVEGAQAARGGRGGQVGGRGGEGTPCLTGHRSSPRWPRSWTAGWSGGRRRRGRRGTGRGRS
jgi:hypothetical protein